MDDVFRGSWVLVTGASSGLGEELARQLAERGANLVLTARSKDKLAALAAQLGAAHGIRAEVIDADLAADRGSAELAARLDALPAPIDHVIANAGFGAYGELVTHEARDVTQMVRVNCEALAAIVHHCLPGMIARRRGGIMLIASTASFQPTPMFAVYGATKAFVRSFGEALAEEVRGKGVRVSVVCPGPVETGFQARAGSTISEAQRSSVLSAGECVRRAIEGYRAGRTIVVPGAVNRAGALLATVMPNRIVVPVVRRMMSSKRAP